VNSYNARIMKAVEIAIDGKAKERRMLAERLRSLRDRLVSTLGLSADDLHFLEPGSSRPVENGADGLTYDPEKVTWVARLGIRARVLLRYEIAFHYDWDTELWQYTIPGCIQADEWHPLDGHEAGLAEWLASVTALALKAVRLEPGATEIDINAECRKQGQRLHDPR